MKTVISFLSIAVVLVLYSFSSIKSTPAKVIKLTYRGYDIQKEFDTLYSHQQIYSISTGDTAYIGFVEQALAICHSTNGDSNMVQNVLSSMYLNHFTGNYDCVTSTVFTLPGGTITANGIFVLVPGDTIAPNHDFPITGGTGMYRHIYGTYTRKYVNGVYNVELEYRKLPE